MPFNVDDALEKLSEQRAEISRLCGLLERALPFVKEDLQHNGISKLTVEYLGRPLIMTWYSGGQPCLRSMTFDGKGHVFDNPDCRYIMKAALDRARNRIYEIVAEINRERASHP